MRNTTFAFKVEDARELFVYRWLPDAGTKVKAVVHVIHGMAEHGGRYAEFAEALVSAGYAVYAHDQRGHGRSTNGPEELGVVAPSRGFARMVEDLEQLLVLEQAEHVGAKAVVFGHSMGSALAVALLERGGSAIHAAVLSGTMGNQGWFLEFGRIMARLERLRLGARGRSRLLDRLSFGKFNDAFQPNRTPFDWLSRDGAEVDKYIADDLCGFIVTTGFWVEFLDGLRQAMATERLNRIPKALPVYLLSGGEDPVGNKTQAVRQLVTTMQHLGLTNVTHRFYPNARHEMLHEVNRTEVIRELILFLDSSLVDPRTQFMPPLP